MKRSLNPACPHCSSLDTNKHGCKGDIRRYLCKTCGSTFYGSLISDEKHDIKNISEYITHIDSGQIIKDLRGVENWSMQRLSDASGYCVTTIYMIEKARHGGGYWRTVCDLIDTMGYDVIIKKRVHVAKNNK